MITLLQNGEVYAPQYLGKKDILLVGGKIAYIEDHIQIPDHFVPINVYDASTEYVVPGFIDSHVHIIGGGGEGGFHTRTPEIQLGTLIGAGITTVVGCLGTDGTTRSIASLLAKSRALEEEGMSTYIYTGSYEIPVRTLTGNITDDLILIDKIIGVGEIALSDHRSSCPTLVEFQKVAAAARLGGILSGKAGIVNIHMGDGTQMVDYLEKTAHTTDIPIHQFIPTHMNRNPQLFQKAIEYGKKGGNIDFTTSTTPLFLAEGEVKCSKALATMLREEVSIERITFSSDGQGSLPDFDAQGNLRGLTVGSVLSLFQEVRDCVLQEQIPLAHALQTITSNPATMLKLPHKGRIQPGCDADLVLLNKDLSIHSVLAKGQKMMENGVIVVKGTFES